MINRPERLQVEQLAVGVSSSLPGGAELADRVARRDAPVVRTVSTLPSVDDGLAVGQHELPVGRRRRR